MSAATKLSEMLFDKSAKAAQDLLDWYNIVEDSLDTDDFRRLARLYNHGRFHAWNCPTCGERVRSGNPSDWSHFQGVSEADHVSYPGRPEIFGRHIVSRQCDQCRMQGFSRHGDDLELVGKGQPTIWEDNEDA